MSDPTVTVPISYIDKLQTTIAKLEQELFVTRTQSQCELVKVKFKDVPRNGRIFEYGKVWTVIQNYGDGLLHEHDGTENPYLSVVSFVDEDEGLTLESEVNFIVEKLPPKVGE